MDIGKTSLSLKPQALTVSWDALSLCTRLFGVVGGPQQSALLLILSLQQSEGRDWTSSPLLPVGATCAPLGWGSSAGRAAPYSGTDCGPAEFLLLRSTMNVYSSFTRCWSFVSCICLEFLRNPPRSTWKTRTRPEKWAPAAVFFLFFRTRKKPEARAAEGSAVSVHRRAVSGGGRNSYWREGLWARLSLHKLHFCVFRVNKKSLTLQNEANPIRNQLLLILGTLFHATPVALLRHDL